MDGSITLCAVVDTSQEDLDTFIQAFKVALLYSETDGVDGHLDDTKTVADFSSEADSRIRSDCLAFVRANAATLHDVCDVETAKVLGYEWASAGTDFCLTRNGHGAGFWDRGLGKAGTKLTSAANAAGELHAYIGDDGKVHVA